MFNNGDERGVGVSETAVDVVIVGAGLSGIAAACELRRRCPEKSFVILEGREALGGTWDLFRYPGIRSDSDMYTLGFPFKPWVGDRSIADGPSILAYLQETVREHGIGDHIRYRQQVQRSAWSSEAQRWRVEARDPDSGESTVYTGRFFWGCTGYYRYSAGHTPAFEGRETFGGTVIHPQHWPEDADLTGKRVVVIGSGATAVTLVPELAKTAEHVTMLQRSPTFVVALPGEDRIGRWLGSRLSPERAFAVTRWKNVVMGTVFYQLARRFPEKARKALVKQAQEAVGEACDASVHFNPSYDPWDQRLCVVPEGDLFTAIRRGSASVVTAGIERFTERGIALDTGEELEADVIVTATGLQLELGGGSTLEVDGVEVNAAERYMYKGMMLSGVPNAVLTLGYTNASWTLKVELVCAYVCRLLRHMDDREYGSCVPVVPAAVQSERPIIDLSSGYIRRSLHLLPKQGARMPWRLYQNYFLDRLMIRYGRIEDGALSFRPRASTGARDASFGRRVARAAAAGF